jgi:4-hydroxy-tetrahydrodipicolinate reductase
MAAAFAEQARRSANTELVAVVSRQPPDWLLATPFYNKLDELADLPDLLLDFSLPAGTALAAEWCAKHSVGLVSGVTGLEEKHFHSLDAAAGSAPVLWSPNLSLGVNLLTQLARQAVAALPADFRVHIEDQHHVHKIDAPSGTALMLGAALESACNGLENRLDYSSKREGEIIGKHEISISWKGEKLVLGHEALDRAIFARGALAAAHWLVKQPAGRYSAEDWLSGMGSIRQ